MSEPVIPDSARLIAERLFTNGQNKRAARLVLEMPDKSNGGGWAINAAYDQIKQVTETLQATIAEQAATIERLTGYKTAFDAAREQILHMVGPLEINEILTTMDEACEQAEMGKQEPASAKEGE